MHTNALQFFEMTNSELWELMDLYTKEEQAFLIYEQIIVSESGIVYKTAQWRIE
jgi:hypothetical protein